MRFLVLVSVLLLALRLYAATQVGFGDSEALYASWAAHPQPAYLDHPGLIGLIARAIGNGVPPSPLRAHLLTSLLATAVPWLVFAAARAFGAAREPAALASLAVALVPEIAVGLFALTPDLVLAPAWLGALALAAYGLRESVSDDDAWRKSRAEAALVGAGLLAGVAASAKISGLLLIASLAAAYIVIGLSTRPEAKAARSVYAWAGLAAGIVVLVPIVHYEAARQWPMAHHRLVETQAGAGVAFRNAGALVLGQLAYLSPVFAIVAFALARRLVASWKRDSSTTLVGAAFAIPFVPLFLLCIWSPVAEPHWIAPPLLALPIFAAVEATRASTTIRRRTFVAGAVCAGALSLLAHGWVLVPASARLLPHGADPKLDIASELYGWPTVLESVRERMAMTATPYDPEGHEVVVVGAHWTICAQLQAGLPGVRVGCTTPIRDDFDDWLPRDQWRAAKNVLFVTDNRFGGDGAKDLPRHAGGTRSRVTILRGGRVARTFDLFMYEHHAVGTR